MEKSRIARAAKALKMRRAPRPQKGRDGNELLVLCYSSSLCLFTSYTRLSPQGREQKRGGGGGGCQKMG